MARHFSPNSSFFSILCAFNEFYGSMALADSFDKATESECVTTATALLKIAKDMETRHAGTQFDAQARRVAEKVRHYASKALPKTY